MTKARDLADTAGEVGGGDALGTVTGADLDLSTGNFFEMTTEDQTLSFSNAPAAYEFRIKLTGAGTIQSYSLSSASYDNVSFSVAAQDNYPYGLTFSPDGLKMFMLGITSDLIYQYTLTTAFDLTTAGYSGKSFNMATRDTIPTMIVFNADGTKMYSGGASTDRLYQFTLATAYDLSAVTYDNVSFSFASQAGLPRGVTFSNDGTKMFMGADGNSVFQYNLGSPFAINTASYSTTLDISAQDSNPKLVEFNADGTKMFILTDGGIVYQYTLTTAFILSTASYDGVSFSVAAQTGASSNATAAVFSTDGNKMFVMSSGSDAVYQYNTLGINTATITYPASVKFSGATLPTVPSIGEVDTLGFYTVDGGTTFYAYQLGDNHA